MHNNAHERKDHPVSKGIEIVVHTESREQCTRTNSVDTTAPAEAMNNFVPGVVTDCFRLNIRKTPSPDGEVLTVIDLLSEVMVDMDASTDEFYKVCTAAGIEGFCIKKYIALRR